MTQHANFGLRILRWYLILFDEIVELIFFEFDDWGRSDLGGGFITGWSKRFGTTGGGRRDGGASYPSTRGGGIGGAWCLFCVWDWRIDGGEGGGGAEPIGTLIKRNGKSSASTNRVSFPILWMTKKKQLSSRLITDQISMRINR